MLNAYIINTKINTNLVLYIYNIMLDIEQFETKKIKNYFPRNVYLCLFMYIIYLAGCLSKSPIILFKNKIY